MPKRPPSKMTTVYFKQHIKREKEKTFFNFLNSEFPNADHIDNNYPLDEKLLTNFIDIPKTTRLLKNDTKLPSSKRNQTIAALATLPDKVYVARSINEVSVDFTIVINNKVHFIELHEKQHSQLSVSRLTPIRCSNNQRFEIPRFAQRLLKDLWRLENLPNYKIVWWDWFDKNKSTTLIADILNAEEVEFSVADKFSLSNLLKQT